MHVALPIIGAALLFALFAGREPDRSAPRRLIAAPPKRVGGPGVIVPFTKQETEEGDVVLESPETLAAAASQRLGRNVGIEPFLLATMISSEEGRGTPEMQAGVAWSAINKAARRGLSLTELLVPDGRLASQSVGYRGSSVRYAAADEPPTSAHLAVAEGVLSRRIPDPTGGATGFDSPRTQRALLARGHKKTKRTPEQIAEDRMKSGMELVRLPNVDPERLRFWRPKARGAAVSGNDSGDDFYSSEVGLIPLVIARSILTQVLRPGVAHAAPAHGSVPRGKPITPFHVDQSGEMISPSFAGLVHAANTVMDKNLDPYIPALAAAMEAEGGDRAVPERVAIGHIILNRAKFEGKRLMAVIAPEGRFGTAGKDGRLFSSNIVPSRETLGLAEVVWKGHRGESGGVPDPTSGAVKIETVLSGAIDIGWEDVGIEPPTEDAELGIWAGDDGLVGHDETYLDGAEDAVAGKKPGIPTQPSPKLVEALAAKWGLIWGVPGPFIQTIADIESSLVPAKFNLGDRAAKLGGAWGLMAVTFTSALDIVRWVKAAPENDQYKEIKRVLKEKWHGKAEDLLDPELNVMLGSYYLAHLYKEFADFDRTAAAYHAGPGGVRRAIKKAVRDGTGNWRRHLGPYSNIYIGKATDTYPKYKVV